MNDFAGKTHGEALALVTTRFADREALVFNGRRWSFREAKAEIDRASARLATLGLQPGDKVALWLPNRPEYLWYWLGACQMGLVAVLLNTRLQPEEVAYQLRQSDTRALIVPGPGAFRDFLGVIETLCPEIGSCQPGRLDCAALPQLRHVVVLDPQPAPRAGTTDWSAPPPRNPPTPPMATDPQATAMIIYTSGTTALPKGAMLRHSVWRKAADHGDRFDQTADDRLFLCVPLFGILANVNGILTFWTRGCCVVLADHFDPEVALGLLDGERCTAAYLLPVMIEKMIGHPRRQEFDLRRLRTGIIVSSDPRILEDAVARLPMPGMFASYGMTETSSAVLRTRADDPLEVRLHSHGRPFPDIEVRIADPETNAPLPAGQVGEIQVRGYCITAGYYNKPEETQKAMAADGWFKTGDAGLVRPDGNFKFLNRLKDSYKFNGFNVSTTEVETVLAGHPAVAAAAIVGLPDEIHGEIGAAFVIPRDGAPIDPAELLAYLRPKLSGYKLPQHIFTVAEFPVTAGTGRVQKFRLRELALQRAKGTSR